MRYVLRGAFEGQAEGEFIRGKGAEAELVADFTEEAAQDESQRFQVVAGVIEFQGGFEFQRVFEGA